MAMWDRIRTVVIGSQFVRHWQPWPASRPARTRTSSSASTTSPVGGKSCPTNGTATAGRPAEPDWRPKLSRSRAAVGAYNDQATMDREIVVAADHGVDFFSILWYFAAPGSKEEADCKRLNRGLENFLRSPQPIDCGSSSNTATTRIGRRQRRPVGACCIAAWVAAMRHPSCLRVGGRLVFKVHDAAGFWRQNDQDVSRCRGRLARVCAGRSAPPVWARCSSAGRDEPIAGDRRRAACQALRFHGHLHEYPAGGRSRRGISLRGWPRKPATPGRRTRPIRSLGCRTWPWAGTPALGPTHRPTRIIAASSASPPRPNGPPSLRCRLRGSDKYPGLGLPLPHGRRQRVFTIYAWNEFGEGGFLAPTEVDGFMKPEAIREVFSAGQ